MKKYLIITLLLAGFFFCKEKADSSLVDLKPVPQQTDMPMGADVEESGEMFVIIKEGAELFAQENVNSDRIAYLKYGEKVDIIDNTGDEIVLNGKKGSWFKVRAESSEGYIFSSTLANQKPSDADANQKIVATFSKAILRDLPHFEFVTENGMRLAFEDNQSDIEFLVQSTDSSAQDQNGMIANREYVGKKFELQFESVEEFSEAIGQKIRIMRITSATLIR
ncbi:MAG: SH3 domain-containing protein [Leptospiraceae bacterium]|nr:SH3 domain-containing protein [Leptospiraceae bacterium]